MNIAVFGERNVQQFGEYTQAIFEGREYSNVELLGYAERFAAALHEAGVKPGDRVGVMLPNLPEVGIAYSGILRMGAIAMPMIFLLAIPEIRLILEDSEATLIMTSPEFHPNVAAAIQGMSRPPKVVVVGDVVPEGCLSYAQMVAASQAQFPIVPRQEDDLAVIMYTSGTTGRPKGVMLSHGNMTFNAESSAKAVDLRQGDISIQALPLSHLFGMAATVTGSLRRVTGVLLRWFTPEGWFDAVNRYRATTSAAVPAMIATMLAHPDFDAVDWSSFRWCVVAAAPVPVEMAEEFEKRTGARILEGYGMTETSPTVSVARPDGPRRLGHAGHALPGVEVAILDDDGNAVPKGEQAEICVRGPNVMQGYYRMPDVTAEAMRFGWLHTGDIGYLDDEEFLHITERKKDLIIRGGFNIFPRDIEELIYTLDGVQECAVVGLPDARLGEEVVAYVVPRPGATISEDAVIALCREGLAKYKTPKHVKIVDALPKNPIGKILKKDLRSRAVEDFA